MAAIISLTHTLVCGVCGGRLIGRNNHQRQRVSHALTTFARPHNKGDFGRYPKRYKLPADVVEQHIVTLIKQDLARLKDDPKLQEYIAQEIGRLSGNDTDARQQLQRALPNWISR